MAYRGDWTSTVQVTKPAVDGGYINRLGTLDPTTGGETYRQIHPATPRTVRLTFAHRF